MFLAQQRVLVVHQNFPKFGQTSASVRVKVPSLVWSAFVDAFRLLAIFRQNQVTELSLTQGTYTTSPLAHNHFYLGLRAHNSKFFEASLQVSQVEGRARVAHKVVKSVVEVEVRTSGKCQSAFFCSLVSADAVLKQVNQCQLVSLLQPSLTLESTVGD